MRVAYLAGGADTVGLEIKVLPLNSPSRFDCPLNHEQKLKRNNKNIKSIEEKIADVATLVKVMTIFSRLIPEFFVTMRLGFHLTTTKRGHILKI